MDPSPTLPERTDIVVVGGGVMGTSSAFFLASDTDRSVTLIEKDSIAAGSTGDSSAILRHHYGGQSIYTEMAWWSHDFYRSFQARTGQPLVHVDAPLVRFGQDGTITGQYVEDGYEVLSGRDIPVSRYDHDQLPDRYPMFAGLDRYDFAVSDDAAGYSDGTDAASGFARAAAEHGATVVTGTGVRSVLTAGGGVVGVETTDGPVECDAVVIAAGPWTPSLAETVGLEVPITPTREHVVILDPPADYVETYPDLTPTTSLPGGEWYLRPDFGEGVLVATHFLTEECDPEAHLRQPDEETLLDLTEKIVDVIPELADAGIKGRYTGVYSTTPDHDFIIDEVGPDGCYLACGFSGHGFKHGPAVGRIVTDLVMDGDTGLVDVDYFSLSRFEDDPTGHGRPADNT